MNAVTSNNEIPFLISYEIEAEKILADADGIILTGGGDIDPVYFGEPLDPRADLVLPIRDAYEIELCKKAFALNKPILAICRGVQVLNVALGGSLFQHVDNHSFPETRDKIIHDVNIFRNTRLYEALGAEIIGVNSIHHQAINRVADVLRVSAVSPDGIPEAVEAPDKKFVVGVQWHPEALLKNAVHNQIFKEFFAAWKL
jgi:putative glutamine amidotransferase